MVGGSQMAKSHRPKVLASSKTASSSSPVNSLCASFFAGCDGRLCFAGGDEKGGRGSATTLSCFGLD